MAACIKLSQMMYDSFSELRFLLNDVTAQGPGAPVKKRSAEQTAVKSGGGQVIDFRARRSV
jgi:hypothetical protein